MPVSSFGKSLRAAALVTISVLALSACAARQGRISTPDYSAFSTEQRQTAVADLAQRYQANPRDRQSAIRYAAALRSAGQPAQAASVLEGFVASDPNDIEVRIAYAKALAAAGQFEQALNIIDRAISVERPDWAALSVKGAVLDQMGRNAEARQLYQQGLLYAPNEPALHANLGLSYAMTNDLVQAETHLGRAASLPGATGQVRQNLALVIGLQGRFDEARAIYASVLPEAEVEANMAYIRALLTQQNRWDLSRDAA